ncbi:unnamed protein product [Somion occarium]|uniref:Uncharacterized protein n=1 Tax=Somion occarium TaxID=3059160 RepID=A0ABP1D7C3_9APHY
MPWPGEPVSQVHPFMATNRPLPFGNAKVYPDIRINTARMQGRNILSGHYPFNQFLLPAMPRIPLNCQRTPSQSRSADYQLTLENANDQLEIGVPGRIGCKTCEQTGCVHECVPASPGLEPRLSLFSVKRDPRTFKRHIDSAYHKDNVNRLLGLSGNQLVKVMKRLCPHCGKGINSRSDVYASHVKKCRQKSLTIATRRPDIPQLPLNLNTPSPALANQPYTGVYASPSYHSDPAAFHGQTVPAPMVGTVSEVTDQQAAIGLSYAAFLSGQMAVPQSSTYSVAQDWPPEWPSNEYWMMDPQSAGMNDNTNVPQDADGNGDYCEDSISDDEFIDELV